MREAGRAADTALGAERRRTAIRAATASGPIPVPAAEQSSRRRWLPQVGAVTWATAFAAATPGRSSRAAQAVRDRNATPPAPWTGCQAAWARRKGEPQTQDCEATKPRQNPSVHRVPERPPRSPASAAGPRQSRGFGLRDRWGPAPLASAAAPQASGSTRSGRCRPLSP